MTQSNGDAVSAQAWLREELDLLTADVVQFFVDEKVPAVRLVHFGPGGIDTEPQQTPHQSRLVGWPIAVAGVVITTDGRMLTKDGLPLRIQSIQPTDGDRVTSANTQLPAPSGDIDVHCTTGQRMSRTLWVEVLSQEYGSNR